MAPESVIEWRRNMQKSFLRGNLPLGDQRLERGAFGGGQRDNVKLLGHERAPFVTIARKDTRN